MMLEMHENNIEYAKLKKIVEILKHDGVIIYPTDTIYGFGADINNPKAIERVYKIKQKQSTGFSFIIPDLSMIAKYAHVNDYAYRIMKKLLPGPYTFILKATKLVPKQLIPNKKTVAIRIPNNKICLELVKKLNSPIITTSVNLSGQPPFSDPLEMEQQFGNQVDIIINAGILPNDPSSVIDLTGDQPLIVRRGKGDVSMFE